MTNNQKIGLAALLLFFLWKNKPIGDSNVTIDYGTGPIDTSGFIGQGVYHGVTSEQRDMGFIAHNQDEFDRIVKLNNVVKVFQFVRTDANGVPV